jgi:hypothetical protein
MSVQSPFKISEIELNNIQYKNIKESTNRKIIFIKYRENKKHKNLVFQLPTLVNDSSIDSKDIEIILNTKDNNKKAKLINFLNELDNKIIQDAKLNASVWFDHIQDKTNVNYNHIIRNFKDNESIKFKILNEKEFKTNLFIDDEIKIDIEDIPTNGEIKCILELYAIWINGNNFGPIIRPVILSFLPDTDTEYNYEILNETEAAPNNYDMDSDIDSDIDLDMNNNSKVKFNNTNIDSNMNNNSKVKFNNTNIDSNMNNNSKVKFNNTNINSDNNSEITSNTISEIISNNTSESNSNKRSESSSNKKIESNSNKKIESNSNKKIESNSNKKVESNDIISITSILSSKEAKLDSESDELNLNFTNNNKKQSDIFLKNIFENNSSSTSSDLNEDKFSKFLLNT